ncbi:spore protease YyaC [Paenibacillus aurantius]|uniref:Spore protease YyaC n=1 Tax=Paenibacillus aurantius TaxID=2918900 RepID=A0AA96LFM5_9BACL|nr:spore protease YyaC [Paenibacillus aurantius]WNQ12420.1 spore protease YyaC [Paenibacillus aurantius]
MPASMRSVIPGTRLPRFLEMIRERTGERLPVLVCVGTDRSTGDSLGPLTGTLLEEAGWPDVIGTLARPCDSSNLVERLKEIPAGRPVIAVDCGVGASVGFFQASDRPLNPGQSMGKPLPPVGDYTVLAIVAENTANPYKVLGQASLYRVLTMAREITATVLSVYPEGIKPAEEPCSQGPDTSNR